MRKNNGLYIRGNQFLFQSSLSKGATKAVDAVKNPRSMAKLWYQDYFTDAWLPLFTVLHVSICIAMLESVIHNNITGE